MNSRRISLLVALPAALTLAACSSSTSGIGHPAGGSGTGGATAGGGSGFPSSGAPSSGAPSSGGAPSSVSELVSRMQSASNSVTSAHLEMDIESAGQSVTGGGDEQLSAGKLVAMDLTMQLPSLGDMQMIVVDGKAYVKLPAEINTSDRPYILVSANSTNPTARAMASTLDQTLSQASLSSYSAMMSAATSFKVVGPATVGGVSATQYSIVLDVSKLPDSVPGREQITAAGLTQLPLELYLDDQNRAVEVTEHISISGVSADTKITVTDYNKPVSISAPPADQVSTD